MKTVVAVACSGLKSQMPHMLKKLLVIECLNVSVTDSS